MLVTLSVVTVPLPLVTAHVVLAGADLTVTEYAAPLTIGVANVKLVAPAATLRSSPPLSCRTRPVAVRPLTMPPMVDPLGVTFWMVHETAIFAISAAATARGLWLIVKELRCGGVRMATQ